MATLPDKYERKETRRPEHPDGTKYRFNCCTFPDVWRTSRGGAECANCGTNWTGALP